MTSEVKVEPTVSASGKRRLAGVVVGVAVLL